MTHVVKNLTAIELLQASSKTIERLRRRLQRIAEIIELVDHRAMACDGPVTPTLEEMTQKEISEIYRLAKGRTKCRVDWGGRAV